jgi:mannose/fructose-specific phosphotransferase system component IIA
MSDSVQGVIIAHASLGAAMVEAVETIVGPTDRIVGVTNQGCGREAILERLSNAAVGADPTIVFVDLPGGSCHTAALRLQKSRDDVAVVAGVNLPMLLDFVTGAAGPLATVAKRVTEAGNRHLSGS